MAFKMKGWNAGAGTGSASPMKQKKYPTGALIPDEEKMREIAAKGKDPKELKTRKVAKKEKKYPTGAKMSTPEQMKEATKGALKPEDAPWMKGKKHSEESKRKISEAGKRRWAKKRKDSQCKN